MLQNIFEYLIFCLKSIQLKKKTMLTTGNADINVRKNCDNNFFIFSFYNFFSIIFSKAFVPNLAIKSPGSNRFIKFCKIIKWTFFLFSWWMNIEQYKERAPRLVYFLSNHSGVWPKVSLVLHFRRQGPKLVRPEI